MRVSIGRDFQSKALGGDIAANDGDTGTSTAVGATSLTDTGKAWTTDQWRGHIVYSATRYGVVASNTATVLTIDRWYDPTNPGGAAGSNPATGSYVIGFGMSPAAWLALTESATAPADGDTSLTGELTANGLQRALAVWAHTTGTSSYTHTNTFTSSDGTTRSPAKYASSNTSRPVTGEMLLFSTLVVPVPTLVSGDQLTLTCTNTI